MYDINTLEEPAKLKTPELIKAIVESYDNISKKTREWLIFRIRRSFGKENGNTDQLDFDAVYCHIGRVIDDRGLNYGSDTAQNSLNSPFNRTENCFDEFIGEEPCQGTSATYFDDLAPTLRDVLGENDFDLLRQLVNQTENSQSVLLNCSPGKIRQRAEEISDRLHQLAEQFKKNGRWLIPPRTIKYIAFSPLLLNYEKRYYNGNPLAFFREHLDIYGGMGREELYRFDNGLYQSLINAGQIDEAIPEKFGKKPPLSKEKVARMIPLHKECNGSANKAAKILGCSKTTVIKHWRKAGLSIRKKIGCK